ncbi:MAG: hypothetical protein ACI8PB_003952 [Desulforhopalus sp.]|jgi:hypothetical protein
MTTTSISFEKKVWILGEKKDAELVLCPFSKGINDEQPL